ncbi:hypothetical protein BP6252_08894 [Coleophoma cylindrospora]|uniref:Xylanolytic transcriptional activator regulatory domain-containing protein n=1 Tax=Coleophoma cylindrospora TaxID=1849047 RepID=A0A3D8R7R6_9HELO|nr:hypothetical protein BP6252_08894 [Coleophoma cylindrospora]
METNRAVVNPLSRPAYADDRDVKVDTPPLSIPISSTGSEDGDLIQAYTCSCDSVLSPTHQKHPPIRSNKSWPMSERMSELHQHDTHGHPTASTTAQRSASKRQRCNGAHPACFSCSKTASQCRYELSKIPKATEHKLYVRALEERVAELESGLSYGGKLGCADDHWERLQPREETSMNSLSGAIRELSLSASGFYVGGTAHITLGRLLGSAFPGPQPANQAVATLEARDNPSMGDGKFLKVPMFSRPNVEILFKAYMKYVSPEYPILHSKRLRDMHARRNMLTDTWEVAVLHFVYAIAGSSLQLTGRCGDYLSDEHHECAMRYKDAIVHFLDRRSVIYLSLAAIYSLRTPTKPGPWVLILFAVELCIMLGLHRKASSTGIGLSSELDKRLFWSVYSLDRHSSISTGRPPAISDHDIDALVSIRPQLDKGNNRGLIALKLPLDLDEDTVVLEDFRRALRQDPNVPANPPTTLTEFIHNVRIRRIQSNIQHEIYRVDQRANPSTNIIDDFLSRLSKWRATVPLEDVPLGTTTGPTPLYRSEELGNINELYASLPP